VVEAILYLRQRMEQGPALGCCSSTWSPPWGMEI